MKKLNIITSKIVGSVALLFILGTGACAPIDPETGAFVDTATPATASMSKQINVQKLNPVFVARFDAGSDTFSDMEKGKLLGFIQAQQAEFGDVLRVELPNFSDQANLNEGRYGAIGGFLEEEGFKVEPKLLNDGLTNSLRVYFTKYIATIDPECAKGWRKPVGLDYENLPLPHLGCATASGLAQMVADPKDLISPDAMGAYDGERAAKSIKKYRVGPKAKSKKSGTKSESSTTDSK